MTDIPSYLPPEITSLLLSSGASVAVETESGDTPLHMAMFCNKPDLIKMLLDNGEYHY